MGLFPAANLQMKLHKLGDLVKGTSAFLYRDDDTVSIFQRAQTTKRLLWNFTVPTNSKLEEQLSTG